MTVTPKPEAPTRGTLLGTSAAIFLIRFFPTLASVVALVWLARHTAPAYYGRYQSFWVQWQVLHVVACLGLPTLVLTYPVARLRGLVRASRLHWAGLAGWVGLVASGFGVMQWWGGSAFAPWQAGLFLLLSVPIAILEAYALGRRQLRAVALVSVGYAGLFVLSHGLLVKGMLSSEQLMTCLLLASALRLAALGYLARLGTAAPGPLASLPAAPLAWPTVRSLWAHTAFTEVVQVLFRWVDKLALNFLLPAALFALYFNGTLDVPFLPLLLGAAGSTLLLHFGEPGLADAERMATLRAAATLLGRLVFPLFFFLLFFRRELFGVVFAHRYDAAVPLFIVSLLVVPLRAYNFTALLQHKGQGQRISRGAVLDLALALALMYPLYRLLGLAGVALAFVLSTYAQAGYYLGHTARLLRVPWASLVPWRPWLVQLLGAALGFGLLHTLLAHWLPERSALVVGAGLLGLWLAGQLWLARRSPLG
jgi:O-antigen/teichoic acid export membrane protein